MDISKVYDEDREIDKVGNLVIFIYSHYSVNSVSLKTLLQQGISEPEFYGDLVYRFRKMQVNLTFRSNSENLLTVIKELAIAWILCGRLHA